MIWTLDAVEKECEEILKTAGDHPQQKVYLASETLDLVNIIRKNLETICE